MRDKRDRILLEALLPLPASSGSSWLLIANTSPSDPPDKGAGVAFRERACRHGIHLAAAIRSL